jgi:hypothetical protein
LTMPPLLLRAAQPSRMALSCPLHKCGILFQVSWVVRVRTFVRMGVLFFLSLATEIYLPSFNEGTYHSARKWPMVAVYMDGWQKIHRGGVCFTSYRYCHSGWSETADEQCNDAHGRIQQSVDNNCILYILSAPITLCQQGVGRLKPTR